MSYSFMGPWRLRQYLANSRCSINALMNWMLKTSSKVTSSSLFAQNYPVLKLKVVRPGHPLSPRLNRTTCQPILTSFSLLLHHGCVQINPVSSFSLNVSQERNVLNSMGNTLIETSAKYLM